MTVEGGAEVHSEAASEDTAGGRFDRGGEREGGLRRVSGGV